MLDFTVVCMGILELTNFGNYTFIRCFRALRPLRAITKIESLRVSRLFIGQDVELHNLPCSPILLMRICHR